MNRVKKLDFKKRIVCLFAFLISQTSNLSFAANADVAVIGTDLALSDNDSVTTETRGDGKADTNTQSLIATGVGAGVCTGVISYLTFKKSDDDKSKIEGFDKLKEENKKLEKEAKDLKAKISPEIEQETEEQKNARENELRSLKKSLEARSVALNKAEKELASINEEISFLKGNQPLTPAVSEELNLLQTKANAKINQINAIEDFITENEIAYKKLFEENSKRETNEDKIKKSELLEKQKEEISELKKELEIKKQEIADREKLKGEISEIKNRNEEITKQLEEKKIAYEIERKAKIELLQKIISENSNKRIEAMQSSSLLSLFAPQPEVESSRKASKENMNESHQELKNSLVRFENPSVATTKKTNELHGKLENSLVVFNDNKSESEITTDSSDSETNERNSLTTKERDSLIKKWNSFIESASNELKNLDEQMKITNRLDKTIKEHNIKGGDLSKFLLLMGVRELENQIAVKREEIKALDGKIKETNILRENIKGEFLDIQRQTAEIVGTLEKEKSSSSKGKIATKKTTYYTNRADTSDRLEENWSLLEGNLFFKVKEEKKLKNLQLELEIVKYISGKLTQDISSRQNESSEVQQSNPLNKSKGVDDSGLYQYSKEVLKRSHSEDDLSNGASRQENSGMQKNRGSSEDEIVVTKGISNILNELRGNIIKRKEVLNKNMKFHTEAIMSIYTPKESQDKKEGLLATISSIVKKYYDEEYYDEENYDEENSKDLHLKVLQNIFEVNKILKEEDEKTDTTDDRATEQENSESSDEESDSEEEEVSSKESHSQEIENSEKKAQTENIYKVVPNLFYDFSSMKKRDFLKQMGVAVAVDSEKEREDSIPDVLWDVLHLGFNEDLQNKCMKLEQRLTGLLSQQKERNCTFKDYFVKAFKILDIRSSVDFFTRVRVLFDLLESMYNTFSKKNDELSNLEEKEEEKRIKDEIQFIEGVLENVKDSIFFLSNEFDSRRTAFNDRYLKESENTYIANNRLMLKISDIFKSTFPKLEEDLKGVKLNPDKKVVVGQIQRIVQENIETKYKNIVNMLKLPEGKGGLHINSPHIKNKVEDVVFKLNMAKKDIEKIYIDNKINKIEVVSEKKKKNIKDLKTLNLSSNEQAKEVRWDNHVIDKLITQFSEYDRLIGDYLSDLEKEIMSNNFNKLDKTTKQVYQAADGELMYGTVYVLSEFDQIYYMVFSQVVQKDDIRNIKNIAASVLFIEEEMRSTGVGNGDDISEYYSTLMKLISPESVALVIKGKTKEDFERELGKIKNLLGDNYMCNGSMYNAILSLNNEFSLEKYMELAADTKLLLELKKAMSDGLNKDIINTYLYPEYNNPIDKMVQRSEIQGRMPLRTVHSSNQMLFPEHAHHSTLESKYVEVGSTPGNSMQLEVEKEKFNVISHAEERDLREETFIVNLEDQKDEFRNFVKNIINESYKDLRNMSEELIKSARKEGRRDELQGELTVYKQKINERNFAIDSLLLLDRCIEAAIWNLDAEKIDQLQIGQLEILSRKDAGKNIISDYKKIISDYKKIIPEFDKRSEEQLLEQTTSNISRKLNDLNIEAFESVLKDQLPGSRKFSLTERGDEFNSLNSDKHLKESIISLWRGKQEKIIHDYEKVLNVIAKNTKNKASYINLVKKQFESIKDIHNIDLDLFGQRQKNAKYKKYGNVQNGKKAELIRGLESQEGQNKNVSLDGSLWYLFDLVAHHKFNKVEKIWFEPVVMFKKEMPEEDRVLLQRNIFMHFSDESQEKDYSKEGEYEDKEFIREKERGEIFSDNRMIEGQGSSN